MLLIPTLIVLFSLIRRHYRSVAQQLSLGKLPVTVRSNRQQVFVSGARHSSRRNSRFAIRTLAFGRCQSAPRFNRPDARKTYARTIRAMVEWCAVGWFCLRLIVRWPIRCMEYIDRLQTQQPNGLITIVIPEFVPQGWWPKLLHGQAGFMLALRLHERRGIVVVNVPYHIDALVPLTSENQSSVVLERANCALEKPMA